MAVASLVPVSAVPASALPAGASTEHQGPSTPRRESRPMLAKLAAARRAGAGAGAALATSPAAHTSNGGGGSNNASGSTEAERAPARGGKAKGKWGLVRREVLPNPQLMKVTEKIQHVIETLKRPPEERTENDVKLLYTWLMHQEKLSSLFTTMSEVSAKKLCKEMEFRLLRGGEVVVNQGDKGNTCFIHNSGIVSVYVRNAEEQQKYQRLMRATMHSSSSRRLSETSRVNFGAKVVTLTPGATFGELCLIEPDSKRSATVVVDPHVHTANFIVLTAASYLRMTRSQTIEGTITDNIAFLQHMLLFRDWTKMQVMHLVNSMKLLTVPAGQYMTHKGADADALFVILRGEAQECVRLTINEGAEISMGEARGVQHNIAVELTFLGKFDVAGEYIASERKVTLCPVDIRATTDVDCLVLARKLFMAHFGGKDVKKHASKALKRLRAIADERESWRETRVHQALTYPNLRVPITRKLMRLSGNTCMICGRQTHVAGDQLCMELHLYYMLDEKEKKREIEDKTRRETRHRITLTPTALASQAAGLGSSSPRRKSSAVRVNISTSSARPVTALPSLAEDGNVPAGGRGPRTRLGVQLVSKQWAEAEKAGLHHPQPQRPQTTPASARASVTSITRSMHLTSQKKLQARKVPIEDEIRRIRESWPYDWHKDSEQSVGADGGANAEVTHSVGASRPRSRSPPRSKVAKSGSTHRDGSVSAR